MVVNGKGGCGKTTIATNLASALTSRKHRVALIDHDPQASSTFWVSQRDPDMPPIQVVAAHQRSHMYQTQTFQHRLPEDVDQIVVDAHSASRDLDVQSLLRQADLVLIPVLPSSIDIRAGGQFIAELLTHRSFRQRPVPVGVIANRVQPNTETHAKLEQFLSCLDVPAVATFRDSPVYPESAERGLGVMEMKESRAARKELAAWHDLVNWIEAQPLTPTNSFQALRARAASRRDSDAASASATA